MECQICFELFDSTNFIPKMLVNCGHSFCRICLDRLINKKLTVTCPVCREITNLSAVKENLPTNYSLVEIIDKNEDSEQTKNILEKYKFFDTKAYSHINTEVNRYSEPRKLKLKKIVNDDFIYVEEFENNQGHSIFNSFVRRNRRYNFNRNSFLGWFFNEYSWSISAYRKASKCKHPFSCPESIIRRIFFSACFSLILKYPLRYLFQNSHISPYIKKKEEVMFLTQLGIFSLISISKVFNCMLNFYIDDFIGFA